MGGSGGGGNPTSKRPVRELVKEAQERMRHQESLAELNTYLTELLSDFNARDADALSKRLDVIIDSLGEVALDVDRLLFGGSVAKHTYVEGLSDVDALVILNAGTNETPQALLESFRDAIRSGVTDPSIASVEAGAMAVTISYTDGSEIQLLPAMERGGRLVVPSHDGNGWNEIRPRRFAEKLTEVNQRNSGGVVPATKLFKGLVGAMHKDAQISGYHVETIAVDAFRNYEGSTSPFAMLTHLASHAVEAVKTPTRDLTGQSVHVDDHLGEANSSARSRISAEFQRLSRPPGKRNQSR